MIMKIYNKILFLLFGGIFFVSCNDFLDRPPIDQFTDGEFWQNENHARSFMYNIYPSLFPGYESGVLFPGWINDIGDDAVSGANQSPFSPDVIPTSDGSWSFTNIRRANYVIESAQRMDEPEATINHWKGIGHFLRAYYYSSLTFQYGDVPYFDKVPQYSENKEDMDYLYKDRDSRASVVEKNIEDFNFAMANIRSNDGALQINRYVVAALASRLMLREATFQKYYLKDNAMAAKCLQAAKAAAELVMSGPYSLSPSYKALFTSTDLAGNPEIIMYRKYMDGILQHGMVTVNFSEAIGGVSKSFAESFLRSDGLPIYFDNEFWMAPTVEDFFTDRDPRMTDILRPKYCLQGGSNAPFNYSLSGYSWRKFMDDTWLEDGNPMKNSPLLTGTRNITAAPVLRLGEVLLNYAEICYELESVTGNDVFNQAVLDLSINKLRDRASMPRLQESGGGLPAVNGIPYDDPRRTQWEPANDVSPMLWEIRRERRIELCFEGMRSNDLKRWGKLDYLCNQNNPDFRYGAYIRYSDYPAEVVANVRLAYKIDPVTVDILHIDGSPVREGYIIRNTGPDRRELPQPKNYVKPIPMDQIDLYKSRGYTLTQTKEWQ